MADYLDEILATEGGQKIVHDPDDAGGVTKFGISQRAYPDVDIANLTAAQAKAIYQRDFVEKPGFDKIAFLPLQYQLVDFAVNAGPHVVACLFQHVVRAGADGNIGPQTLAAFAACDQHTVNNQLVALRCEFYQHVVNAKPYNQKFLKGWLRRAQRFYLP